MLTISDSSDPVRKAAVSLNNSAVILLSKGFLVEAMETLKDLVIIMKSASVAKTTTTANDDNDGSISKVEEVEALWVKALHHAQQRLAASASDESFSPILQTHVVTPLSSQTHAYSLLRNGEFINHRIPMPIIIDKTLTLKEEEEEDKESTFDFECATVLYNYGLMYSLSATKRSPENRNSTMLIQSALRIQELAATVLARVDERTQQQLNSCCYFPMQERVLLGLLLTRGLIQSYEALSQSPPKEYCMALIQLQSYVEQQHEFYPAAHELRIAPVA